MIDIKWIRDNPEEFDSMLLKRGFSKKSNEIIDLDSKKRKLLHNIQQLQHLKKNKSKSLVKVKEVKCIKDEIFDIDKQIRDFLDVLSSESIKLKNILDTLPNIIDPDVPYGVDEGMNKVLRSSGLVDFVVKKKQHFELGEQLGMMDFTQTAKISGSKFVCLKMDLAKLERALINFMIDIHTKEFNFIELSVPYLVHPISMYNAGQLPKFDNESFETKDSYRLIPTGEVSLVNMVADSIIDVELLPIRYVTCTPCFRSEAGSSSKDTKGMIRLHQFHKVELVSITTPNNSMKEHEYIVNAAEEILKKLKLPYRVVLLCTGDMPFSAIKTYDLEVWLPSQNIYKEISSCSNCGDFQSRRMKARYKLKESGIFKNSLVHTLNGSALAIGRTIVAILENYQNDDGSITVPDVLVSYMGGQRKIPSRY